MNDSTHSGPQSISGIHIASSGYCVVRGGSKSPEAVYKQNRRRGLNSPRWIQLDTVSSGLNCKVGCGGMSLLELSQIVLGQILPELWLLIETQGPRSHFASAMAPSLGCGSVLFPHPGFEFGNPLFGAVGGVGPVRIIQSGRTSKKTSFNDNELRPRKCHRFFNI
jgi:hypothetical protein